MTNDTTIKDFATNYLNDIKRVLDYLPLGKVEEFVKYLLAAYEGKKHIYVFGNGGSGVTASHFAYDMNKGVSSSLRSDLK